MRALLTTGYYLIILMTLVIGAFLVMLHFDVLPGYEIRIVQSGSMEPTLPIGSVVLIRPAEEYAVGDIVTFGGERGSLPTTHRIIGDNIIAGELAFTTKGDANEDADITPVLQEDIRGKVSLTIPYLGFLLDFARQPIGFALLIGIPAFLIVIEEVSNIWSAVRGTPRREEESAEAEEAEKSPL
jgi:signal peptidase